MKRNNFSIKKIEFRIDEELLCYNAFRSSVSIDCVVVGHVSALLICKDICVSCSKVSDWWRVKGEYKYPHILLQWLNVWLFCFLEESFQQHKNKNENKTIERLEDYVVMFTCLLTRSDVLHKVSTLQSILFNGYFCCCCSLFLGDISMFIVLKWMWNVAACIDGKREQQSVNLILSRKGFPQHT